MKIKQTLLVFALTGMGAISTLGLSTSVGALQCGDVETSVVGGSVCDNVESGSGDLEKNAIWSLLLLSINILTAGVGILAVGGIILAGLRYSAARENAAEVTKAKEMILNIVIGLIAYAAMYAFLQFLIPGGIFT